MLACRGEDGRWESPRTIVRDEKLFVNWADFPAVVALADGRLAAHWLRREEGGPYAYHAWVAFSDDRGASWTTPVRLHDDLSPQEHGFVTLIPDPDGGLDAIWLDGRAMPEDGETRLLTRRYADGAWTAEEVLDPRVCDCCQTAAARSPSGEILTLYRDRSPQEVRDIGSVRGSAGHWGAPLPFSRDGWTIAACPVQGPALAIDADGRLAAGWFSSADDRPRVWLATSDDGQNFGAPRRVAEGEPARVGRVDVAWHEGRPWIAWFARVQEQHELRVAAVDGDGDDVRTVTRVAPGRGSGFPSLLSTGDALWVAWTDPDEEAGGVRLASLP